MLFVRQCSINMTFRVYVLPFSYKEEVNLTINIISIAITLISTSTIVFCYSLITNPS